MTTVTGKLIGAANPQRVEMRATLVDVTGKDAVGYVTSLEGELVRPVTFQAETDGDWTVSLTANALISSQSGDTLWAVQEGRSAVGQPVITYIVVPETGGPYWVGEIRAALSTTPTGDGSVVYLAGQPGPAGADGQPGASAYQIAVAAGFVGTEAEWIASLAGEDGAPGAPGTPGTAGEDGQDGASAYQVAVAAGFAGTQAEWLASLVGPEGEQGLEGPQPPLGAAGAGADIALRSTDPTTTNSRTPTAHKASHATGGSDPLTPGDIGAETSGTAATAVTNHAGATDPHGDRAWADAKFATQLNLTALNGTVNDLTTTVAAIDGFLNDCLTRVSAIEQGNAYLAGGHYTSPVELVNSTPPGANPAGGVFAYAEGGVFKTRGTSGTIASLLPVGTAAGTVAAGNDSRLTDSRTPSGSASGDLSGSYPGPTVAKVNGVTVSGTPTSGQVLTASSGSAASWQTPAGGGGAALPSVQLRVTDGALVDLPSATVWEVVTPSGGTTLKASIAAAAGDRVRVEPDFMRSGGHFLEWVILNGADEIVYYGTTRSSTPPDEGAPSMYPSTSFPGVQAVKQFVVEAGWLSAGTVTIALAHKGTAVGRIYAHTTYPFEMLLTNLGANLS